jgi:hypothetical protein
VLVDISDERENNRDTPPREVWSPAASQTADARFGSPGSRHGDMAGGPPLQGRQVRAVGTNLGGTAEGFAFRPNSWDGGYFFVPKLIKFLIF